MSQQERKPVDKEAMRRAVAALGDEDYTRRKNRRKRLRTCGEFAVIVAACYLLVRAFFTFGIYEPYPESAVDTTGEDTGFIALSYFGVDRTGHSSTLIGEERLADHLQVLHDRGYVTITTKDIEAYYRDGQPLPPAPFI